jgi:hypothetical protein
MRSQLSTAQFSITCPITTDWNGDGAVDLTDYGALERCLTGPAASLDRSCAALDLNGDGAVDLADFALFSCEYRPL